MLSSMPAAPGCLAGTAPPPDTHTHTHAHRPPHPPRGPLSPPPATPAASTQGQGAPRPHGSSHIPGDWERTGGEGTGSGGGGRGGGEARPGGERRRTLGETGPGCRRALPGSPQARPSRKAAGGRSRHFPAAPAGQREEAEREVKGGREEGTGPAKHVVRAEAKRGRDDRGLAISGSRSCILKRRTWRPHFRGSCSWRSKGEHELLSDLHEN
ncbi:uncharacterized protein [Notamacropus eugenii]|uniref:uncharacterized protein n=1 Tax=Notamacropus eugenii TaxID=9315 RepID=UPI003B67AE9D